MASFYHDRFLCRTFASSEPAFVLKGGQSMLAKIPNTRETRDVDLLGRTPDLDEALSELKETAAVDLGDFIEFRFRDAVPTDTSQDYREGYTVTFDTWLGGTKRIGALSVDLVVDPIPPTDFEVLTPAARLDVAGLVCFDYVANTSETRVAEKICATMQTYATGPSSRVKDLADLVTSMLNENVDAGKLARRLSLEVAFRHMNPIDEFAVPAAWKTTFSGNYRKMAREAKLPHEFKEVAAAEAAVADWLRPVLEGKAERRAWSPEEQAWI
ncbi:MAG: nucleotidyl transferase AbiEii/AbiGii toxin family protein [Atopobiaceae bacterium]|nr:nucleotidyl transferase AbiEii/AbiGii toxin family protein [Atopobiaceae bacterium]